MSIYVYIIAGLSPSNKPAFDALCYPYAIWRMRVVTQVERLGQYCTTALHANTFMWPVKAWSCAAQQACLPGPPQEGRHLLGRSSPLGPFQGGFPVAIGL